MSLHEMFPAVQTAEMAVQRDPHSWEAWQTLGRAQLGLGEITLVRMNSEFGSTSDSHYTHVQKPLLQEVTQLAVKNKG